MMKIGQAIRGYRKKNRLSQREVAERLGVAQATISYWESEHMPINVREVERLASVYKVSSLQIMKKAAALGKEAAIVA